MAKRAGGELNHENWNDEDAPEEAGQFRQASVGALQGRVIKTARRRRAVGGEEAEGGGESKSAFAGFGGFSKQPPADASAAFSFLAKPAVTPASPASSGFSFGGDKPAAAAPGGFAFGNSGSSKPAETSGFSFGSSTFSSSPKTTFGSSSVTTEPSAKKAAVFGSFGGSSDEKTESKSVFGNAGSETKTEPAAHGAFLFGAKTEEKPPPVKSDEAPKSVPESKPAPAFGASGGFSFGAVSAASSTSGFASKCEENKENSTSTFSFGAKSPATDKPALGAFAFGAKPAEEAKIQPASETFSFGAKTSTEDSTTKAPAFSFGAKSSEDSNNKAAAFSFGSNPSDDSSKKASTATFAFGNKPAEETKPESQEKSASFGGFAFGAASSKKPTDEAKEKKSTDGSFSFGTAAKSAAGGSFSFGSSKPASETNNSTPSPPPVEELSGSGSSGAASPRAASPSREFLAHLKALNTQVAAWIQQHLDLNPLVLLTPVFKDYDRHLAEITVKYRTEEKKPLETKAPPNTTVTTAAPAFGSSSFSQPAVTSDSSQSSSFKGLAPTTEKPSTSAAPFSFGLTSAPSSVPAFGGFGAGGAAPGGFSFGSSLGSSAPATTTNTAEDDEDAPPVVEVKQVQEDDAIYSKKCKLFYKKDGSYVEKGVGMLYLKKVEGEKTQLLVRADTNLGNVLLNILLSAQIPTTRVGKNNVMLVCVPNPPVDPKADTSAPCPMLIRVKDADAADELKAKIDECAGK